MTHISSKGFIAQLRRMFAIHHNTRSSTVLFRQTLFSKYSLLSLVVLFLCTIGWQKANAQCCLTTSLNISTGYNPVTASAVAGAPNGTIQSDPKWKVAGYTADVVSHVGSTGWTIVPVGNQADIIQSGGTAMPNSSPISCLDADNYNTGGVAGPTYYMDLERDFYLVCSTTVTFNLSIECDNGCDVYLDGSGTSLYNLPVGTGYNYSNWGGPNTFTYTTGTLTGGAMHSIKIRVYNYNHLYPDMNYVDNYTCLRVSGTVTSSTTNGLRSESTAACTSATTYCTIPPITGPAQVCKNGTVTLADAEPGGTWSSSVPAVATVSTSGAVHGLTVGSTVISYTDACGRVATYTFNVRALPSATAIAGNFIICAGASTTLTATATYSGTGTLEYSWNNASACVCSTHPVTPAVTTVYTVEPIAIYSGTLQCAGPVKTATVTVNPVPSFSVSMTPTPLCVGTPWSLTSSPACATCSYHWTGPSLFTSSVADPSMGAATTAMTGVYALTVTNTSGCHAVHTETVTVHPLPAFTPTFTPTSPFCEGSTLQLSWNTPSTAVAGNTYSWTGPNAFSSTARNPSIPSTTILNSGTYTLTVTNSAGCAVTNYVSVIINPTPSVSAVATPSVICAGSSTTLTATGTVSGGLPVIYSWTPAVACPSCANTVATPTVTTNYVVTAVVGSCSNTATAHVIVHPMPVFTPTFTPAPPTVLCSGATLHLLWNTPSATVGSDTYSWTGPNSFTSSATNPNIPAATTLNSGIYLLTVTTAFGCSVTNSVSVTINPTPNISAVASPTVICVGQSTTLTATASVSSGAPITYSWAPDLMCPSCNVVCPSCPVTGASPTITTTYSVMAISGGCSVTATAYVVVHDVPPVPVITGTTTICTGVPSASVFTVTPGGGTWYVTNIYPVSPAIGSISPTTGTSTTLTGLEPGGAVFLGYSITNSCGTSKDSVVVKIHPTPEPTILYAPDSMCKGDITTITADPGTTLSYTWAWASNNGHVTIGTTTSTSANVTASTAGTSIITYSVTADGCTGVASHHILVNPVPVFTPTYSPVPLCAGETWTLLWNTPSGAVTGDTYYWTGPTSFPFTSTDADPAMPPAIAPMSGIYVIKVANIHGCTARGTVNVVVNPVPAPFFVDPVPPTKVCVDTKFVVNTKPGYSGAYTYSWTSTPTPGVTFYGETATSAVIIPTVAGTYTVSYSVYPLPSGVCPGTASFTLIVEPSPVFTPTYSPVPLCEGTPWNLYWNTPSLPVPATYAFAWTGPGFSSSLPNPSMPDATVGMSGTYGLTVVDMTDNCPAYGVVTVTVIPTPKPSFVPNPPPPANMCVGQSFYAIGNPGVSGPVISGWSSSAPTVVSVTVSTLNPTFADVVAVSPGTAVVTYSVLPVGGVCPASISFTVTVHPQPAFTPTYTPTPLCAGTLWTLDWDTPPALAVSTDTYTWSGPSGFTSTAADPSMPPASPAANGTYTLTVVSNFGPGFSCAVTNTVSVTEYPVNNAGTIKGPNVVCIPGFILLTDEVPGGTWSSGSPGVASAALYSTSIGGSTGIITGISVGTTIISYTISNPCGTTVATYSVTVLESVDAGTISGPAIVCTGSSIALTDPSPGGTWGSLSPSTATVDATGDVTGISGGTAIISYLVSNACSRDYTTYTVTVVGPPDATISGPSVVCAGSTIALTAGTTGGAWSSSSPTAATINSSGIVTGIASGLTTVSYTVSNMCFTVTATEVVTVNPTPTPYFMPNPLPPSSACIGENFFVWVNAGTTDPGYTSSWSQTGPGSVTFGTEIPPGYAIMKNVTGAGPGLVTIVYSVTNTEGCSGVATLSMSIDAPASAGIVTGPDMVCPGSTITLSDGVSGGSWYSTDGSIASVGITTGVVGGIASGTDIITYMVVDGPCHSVSTYTVTVASSPSVCVTYSETLNGYVFTGPVGAHINYEIGTVGSGGSYLWTGSGSCTIGGGGTFLLLTSTDQVIGLVSVTYDGCTWPASCIAEKTTVMRHAAPPSGSENPAAIINVPDALRLVPDPNKGVFTLTGALPQADGEDNAPIEIVNMVGQVVYKADAAINSGNVDYTVRMDNDLPNGIYIVRIKTVVGYKTIRFTLNR